MAQPQGFMPVSDGAAVRTPTQPLSSRPGMHERQKSYRGVGPSLPTAVRSPSSTRPGRSNTATGEQPQIGPDGQPVRQNSGSTTVRRPSIIGGSRRAVIGVGDLVRAGSRLLGGSTASLSPEQEEANRAAALENAKKKVSHFTQQDYKDTLSELGVNPHLGLSSKEAAARLAIHGLNELEKEPPKPFWKLLLEQFQDILVILLILAAIAALVLGEYAASTVIILIVIANAALGVVQEQRAGAALDALKNTCAAKAQVIRDGTPQEVEASQLVPGDIIRLELGAQVPADLRLIDTQGLAALEAALTGEPDGIKKDANHISKGEHKEEKSAAPATTDGKAPEAKKEEKKDDHHDDEKNMVFFGCTIVEGRGAGVVVKTGMKTKMGEIQHLLNTADDKESPLETKLDALGQRLGLASILISVVVLVIGLTTGRGVEHNSGQPEWLQMLLVAVSLTVAAVPEGLPACVTITLAIGMRRMVQKNAIIRNLHSVETLGSASVICSDKTGTLTAGAMTAVRLWIGGQIFRITGAGYEPYGEIIPIDTNAEDKEAVRAAGEQIKKKRAPLFPLLVALLSSNAEEPVFNQKDKKWESTGNASERPLVVAAVKGGLKKSDMSKIFKREREHTFNSARKMMSVLISTSGDDAGFPELKGTPYFAAVKGAPNIVMENCVDMLQLNESGEGYTRKNMDDGDRKKILDAIDAFSEQAFRVLAIAYRRMDERPANLDDPASLEKSGLTLCGLVASIDPEREAVKPSIHKAHNAGIRVVMITGDYVKTAKAIAENIDIFPKGSPAAKAIDCKLIRDFGEELDGYRDALANDKISKEERQVILGKEKAAMEKLDAITKYVDVYARAKPADKITIVRSLQRQGNVCSMTGDGVNDAPALKQANIGVAMGITGTDVAKNAADMVLTDDNFVSIVEAVEEGRTIYANITKFVFYLLSTNVGEVFVILIAVIIGLPSPLAPIQILWLNLTTDGAPAIALAVEATEPGTMDQGPRLLSEPLLEKVMLTGIVLNMTLLTGIVLTVYIVGLYWHTGVWMQGEDLSMENKQSICDKINSDRISANPPATPFANYDACFASTVYRDEEKIRIEECLKQARTMAILTIVFCELGRAYTARSLRVSIFTMGVFSNKWMQYACGTAVIGTLCVVLIPGLNDVVFDTTYIDGRDWGLVLGISVVPMLWDEFLKAIYRCTGFGKRPRAKFGGMEAKAPEILTGGNAEKKEDIHALTLEATSDQKATTKSDKDIEMGRV